MEIYNNWIYREYRRYRIACYTFGLVGNDKSLTKTINKKTCRINKDDYDCDMEEYHFMFCIKSFCELKGIE